MLFQPRQLHPALGATLAIALLAQTLLAQTAGKVAATSSSSVQQAIHLVTEGRCQQALPVLKKAFPHVVDKSWV